MAEVYRGRLDEGEKMFEKALAADDIERHRSNAYLLKLGALAEIRCERGDEAASLATYETLISTLHRYYPTSIDDWAVAYTCALSRVDIDRAVAVRDSLADELSRRDDDVSHVLEACTGWIEFRRGNLPAASRAFENALAEFDVFQYRYPLGLIYLEAGRLDDAIRTFEHAMNRYSSGRVGHAIWGVKLYYYLAIAYERAGRIDDAHAMYARFLDIWKDSDTPCEEIGDATERIAVLDQSP
jgi:tetratricopeptide (TPR) repeat protein